MSLKINKDLLYCNEVKIVSNSDLIVEVIKKDNTITKEKINTSIEDYYDINTNTNFQIIDDVSSLGETAIGLLEDTIAAEKEQLAIYDDMSSLLNHAMKLQELFVGEEDYDSKAKMYEEQAKVASEKTRTAKDRRQYALDNIDSYAEAQKEAKQKYDNALASGKGDVTVLEKQLEITKQAYEDMKNELKDSTEDFYTSIEEQIEIAKNAYINTINKAMADMENKMTGGK